MLRAASTVKTMTKHCGLPAVLVPIAGNPESEKADGCRLPDCCSRSGVITASP